MKQITEIADARLVKGLAHPLRIEILRILQQGVSSPSEIAERIDAPLGNVSYHVRFLARVGLIEMCETRPRRGAVEHYYRSVTGVHVSDAAWAEMPGPVRDTVLSSTLEEVGRSVGAAVSSGGFDHAEARATRSEITLDCDGFAELSAAIGELYDKAAVIERASAERIAAGSAHSGVAGADPAARSEDAATTGPDGEPPATPGSAAVLRAQLVLMLFDASTATSTSTATSS